MKLKSKKSALLLSFTSLLLCFAMLAGSTFAWFTDTATTGVNKIVAGNLKVDIIGANSEDHVEKLNFTKAAGAEGEDLLWEPGCRYLTEGFRIANKGNLALKWKAEINKDNIKNGKVDSEEAPSKSLLDVIDFYVVTKADDGTETAVAIENFTGKLAANVGKSETYYIKGVMQTTAGNDYQSLTLDGITITVYATQDTVENDSFDNQYDKYAQYGERTVRTGAIEKAADGNYRLAGATNESVNEKNITYSFPAEVHDGNFMAQKFGINSTFEGNGATFNNFELNCAYVSKAEASTVVVSNFNVKGNLIIQAYDNDVIINNCNAQHISVLNISDDTKVIIDGCTVSGVGMDNLSGNNKYGIYITRNSNGGTADVEIINSNISNIKASAIVVNGGTDTSKTATNFTIKGNTFSKYGLDGDLDNKRAAFLIYNDTVLAPTNQQNETVKTMTEAAQALGASIKNGNTFVSADIRDTAVVANFFFATVDFK